MKNIRFLFIVVTVTFVAKVIPHQLCCKSFTYLLHLTFISLSFKYSKLTFENHHFCLLQNFLSPLYLIMGIWTENFDLAFKPWRIAIAWMCTEWTLCTHRICKIAWIWIEVALEKRIVVSLLYQISFNLGNVNKSYELSLRYPSRIMCNCIEFSLENRVKLNTDSLEESYDFSLWYPCWVLWVWIRVSLKYHMDCLWCIYVKSYDFVSCFLRRIVWIWIEEALKNCMNLHCGIFVESYEFKLR